MKNIYLYLSLITLFNTNISSQGFPPKRVYEALAFDNLQPIWYETNFDATCVTDTSDGFNQMILPTDVPDIIEGDNLYSVIYRTGKREAFTGTYLTKRNLNTGELIWQIRYGYPEDPRQEVARLMYINEQGNIETINQVKRDKYLTNKWTFGYNKFVHSKRIFDKENGNLIYHDQPDYGDTSLYNTSFNYYSRTGVFFKEGDSIRYFDLRRDPRPDTFAFDYFGSMIKYDSKKVDVNEKKLITVYNVSNMSDYHLSNPTKLNLNHYLFIESYDSDPEDGLFFRYTDKNLNVLEEYLSDEDLGQQTGLFQLTRISENQNRFLFFNSVHPVEPDAVTNKFDLLIMDKHAKLIRRVELNYKYQNLEILDWNEDNSIKMLALRTYGSSLENNFRISLDLLNIDNEGTITIEKNFVSKDSLRYIARILSKKLNDNKYLLKLWEGSLIRINNFAQNDLDARAISYMLIDGSEFNLGTNTNDIIPELNAYLYPNPSYDELNIDFLETFSGKYDIISTTGAKIISGTISNETRSKVDISMLPVGMYSIIFRSKDSRKLLLSLKFVKV